MIRLPCLHAHDIFRPTCFQRKPAVCHNTKCTLYELEDVMHAEGAVQSCMFLAFTWSED